MPLQPSRPGFMLAGALVFLALPFLWASFAHEQVDKRFAALGVVVALLFLALAAQYRARSRTRPDAPPAA